MALRSIRGRLALRLTLSFLIPTVAGLLAVGLIADQVAQRTLEAQLSERLIAIAKSERAMLEGYFTELLTRVEGTDERSLTNLQKRIAPIAKETGVRRVFIFRPDTLTNIVDANNAVPYGHRYYELEADAVELSAVRDGECRPSVLYTAEDGTPYKYAYAPIFNPNTGEVIAIIGVEGSADQVEELEQLRRNLLILGAVIVLVLLLTETWTARRLRKAVSNLVAAAKRIGAGNLEEGVPQTRTDELGELEVAVDRMREALRSREEELQMMLSGIAHEVRNPLGGIELFVGLLDEDLAEVGHAAGAGPRGHVARVTRELEYLARVVNEFLEYARRSKLSPSRFAAEPFIKELEQVMAADLLSAEVTLKMTVPEGLELTADRDRLRRVLLNLIRNAGQASSPGATVEVEVLAQADKRMVRVTDQGAGIAKEKLEEVFRPFFTTREKGTGLGLPLARKVIEAHGGELHIESEVGKGTQLTLVIPFDAEMKGAESMTDIPDGWLG